MRNWLFSDATNWITHQYTKVPAILSEFYVTAAATCSYGQTSGDNKIDGWASSDC